MRHPLYVTYGALVLAFVAFAQFQGWSLTPVNEVKNIPKTVRDNPGAYRSHYGGYIRYVGGK
jgi:hypothetical protein